MSTSIEAQLDRAMKNNQELFEWLDTQMIKNKGHKIILSNNVLNSIANRLSITSDALHNVKQLINER